VGGSLVFKGELNKENGKRMDKRLTETSGAVNCGEFVE
jgi:hypothetical protein